MLAVKEFMSVDYKIWNSHGDSPTAYDPSYEELKLLKTEVDQIYQDQCSS